MPVAPGPSRRALLTVILASTLIVVTFISFFRNAEAGVRHPNNPIPGSGSNGGVPAHHADIIPGTLTGRPIAPKLGNETAKAELGRAAWKLFHTTFARFPDSPTPDESVALQSYIHLFQRLYPCGECSEHFRTILDKFPPQVSSRSAAAAWGCHVHNQVNKSLNKEIFDCSNIGDFYDCGCAEDEKEAMSVEGGRKLDKPTVRRGKMTGKDGREIEVGVLVGSREPVLEMEG